MTHDNSADLPDLEDFLGIQHLLTANLGRFAVDDPAFAKRLEGFDPIRTATTFGALLTVPELQSNTVRLEVLLHQALALGSTSKKPTDRWYAAAFRAAGGGRAGRLEDPAEDVFVAQINTPRGNFQILEGTWEGAAFYLQRFMYILEAMPDGGVYTRVRKSIYALLKLSSIVCHRAGLERYQAGGRVPVRFLAEVSRGAPGVVAPPAQILKV